MKSIAIAAICLAFAASASADEVWVLPSGNQITYDRDVGDVAVLTYRAEQGLDSGQIFVPGLGGLYEGRGAYQGYWVEADDAGPHCAAALTDAEGRTWSRWGSAHVTFDKPGFPSGIKIKRGDCFSADTQRVSAKPVVGAGVR
jgi:hypothetical protein